MKKILSVFGTRPEAIKMAPVIKELSRRNGIKSVVCVTAQHRGMLDQVLGIFRIKPDYDLNIMKPGQSLSYITSMVLLEFEKVINCEKPDLVLVHGDTTTAMAAALAAYYNGIKIGHIEAGLRTYDKLSPFPEEINRQIIDRIADLLFAPTVLNEHFLSTDLNLNQKIVVTGNTVIDALKTTVSDDYDCDDFAWLSDSRLILLTAHRRENIGEPLKNIFTAINEITDKFEDVKVIFPVHLNPRVRKLANDLLKSNKKVRLVEPLDVVEFHNYMNKAYLIMTDSGGIQEEAPALSKPVLVLREVTERPEGVDAGTLKLVGTKKNVIVKEAGVLLSNRKKYDEMAKKENPYGDGMASKRIVDAIEEYLA